MGFKIKVITIFVILFSITAANAQSIGGLVIIPKDMNGWARYLKKQLTNPIFLMGQPGPCHMIEARNFEKRFNHAMAELFPVYEGKQDKMKHCTLSCIMAFNCSYSGTAILGLAKEFKDLIGPGDAEWADLRADYHGIAIASHIKRRYQCYERCGEIYPSGSQN